MVEETLAVEDELTEQVVVTDEGGRVDVVLSQSALESLRVANGRLNMSFRASCNRPRAFRCV